MDFIKKLLTVIKYIKVKDFKSLQKLVNKINKWN